MPTAVYHLALTTQQTEGAECVLLPGDPQRVQKIAQSPPFQRPRFVGEKRGYCTWLAYMEEVPVLIVSTGIGGPSTAIAVEELAMLGVKTFLRVGTCGAIQPTIAVGDVVISTGAVRLDGASTHYAPLEYPAVAHFEVVSALVRAAQEAGKGFHAGITCSSDTFYPGQERYDNFSQYVPRRFQGATEEWRRLHVLNYEMEAATLFTMCAAFGLKAGCAAGVIVNRTLSEHITPEDFTLAERNVIAVAAEATALLLKVSPTSG